MGGWQRFASTVLGTPAFCPETLPVLVREVCKHLLGILDAQICKCKKINTPRGNHCPKEWLGRDAEPRDRCAPFYPYKPEVYCTWLFRGSRRDSGPAPHGNVQLSNTSLCCLSSRCDTISSPPLLFPRSIPKQTLCRRAFVSGFAF